MEPGEGEKAEGEEGISGRTRRKIPRIGPKDLSEQIAKAQQELTEVESGTSAVMALCCLRALCFLR